MYDPGNEFFKSFQVRQSMATQGGHRPASMLMREEVKGSMRQISLGLAGIENYAAELVQKTGGEQGGAP